MIHISCFDSELGLFYDIGLQNVYEYFVRFESVFYQIWHDCQIEFLRISMNSLVYHFAGNESRQFYLIKHLSNPPLCECVLVSYFTE